MVAADRIKGFGSIVIFKTKIRNSSMNIGKSGGFRIVYYIQKPRLDEYYLLSIYSKTQHNNIHEKEILQIIKEENLDF